MTLNEQEAMDFTLLALCVWREARGEPLEGKKAVAWSVRNRVLHPSWWGTDWATVILHPWQFSSFNRNDPNATLWPMKHEPAWRDSIDAAVEAWEAIVPDPTDGATQYHADSMTPAWAKKMVRVSHIGNHIFYKEI